jgi:hypothetical protein
MIEASTRPEMALRIPMRIRGPRSRVRTATCTDYTVNQIWKDIQPSISSAGDIG